MGRFWDLISLLLLAPALAATESDWECGDEVTAPPPPLPIPHLIIYPQVPPYTIYCDVIKESEVRDPKRIRFPFAKVDVDYILVMVDPDMLPSPFVHWIVVNIPGRLLRSKKGAVVDHDEFIILEYVRPNALGEQHRYQFMLYEQTEPIPYELGTRCWYTINRSPFSEYIFIDDLDHAEVVNKTRPVGYFQYSAYEDEESKCIHGDEYDWDICRRCEDIKMEISHEQSCLEFVQSLTQTIMHAAEYHYPDIFPHGEIPPGLRKYKHAVQRYIFDEYCHFDVEMMLELIFSGTYRCVDDFENLAYQIEHLATKDHQRFLFAPASLINPLGEVVCRRVQDFCSDYLGSYKHDEDWEEDSNFENWEGDPFQHKIHDQHSLPGYENWEGDPFQHEVHDQHSSPGY